MTKVIIGALLTCTLAISARDIVPVAEDAVVAPMLIEENNGWQHSLSVYGWLPSFDGTLKYTIPGDPNDPNDSDKEGESGFVDKIDMVLMGTYEARKDKWSFLVDAIYFKMSDEQDASWDVPLTGKTITAGSEQEFTALLLSTYGGYNLIDTQNASLDVIAGLRYLSLELDISVYINQLNRSISPSVELYDGVIGMKGHINLSENWYVPYMFDVGAGDSDLTWQGQASLGYRFSWGDVLATYRYIHYEKDDTRLVEKLDLYGPKIGFVFHF
ncbi:MAG: hypothetical protein Q9M39_09265 [Sulfurovum sp.]|nr:hypothetical protein [Sulfurovum sp.]